MEKQLTVAIIGCGGRGCGAYGHLMHDSFGEKYKIVALCDIQERVLLRQGEQLEVPKENRFLDEKVFFETKRADLLVIGTQDQDHYRMTVKGLSLGYDVLVEKPLTSSRKECKGLLAAQKKYGGKVFVGHVLRYAPAFRKAEELLHSGRIGKLIAIDALEQVWYGHMAHSFVRGNWRRSDETSPMILAKCCHDLDLLQYYAGSKCRSLSSVGDLAWFKPENAPEGATDRCLDCPHVDTCPYSAKRIYIDRWKRRPDYSFSHIIAFERPLTEEALRKALRETPYGRCVYHCDNNVVDHELTVMTFENGVKASLTMMGCTGNGGRIIKFHGSLGEIILDEENEYVELKIYGEESEKWPMADLGTGDPNSGHGGGDNALVAELYDMLCGTATERSTLEASIESHLMAIAAEESRLAGGKLKKVH
ncbi:MAG: Gfo/Idh/MocA family oxidoreductase [Ruminococcus sp.]|nr:Gfo/Idh/MocA family oxidoreductase [Candidatus Apopatosoma intestinale]